MDKNEAKNLMIKECMKRSVSEMNCRICKSGTFYIGTFGSSACSNKECILYDSFNWQSCGICYRPRLYCSC